MTGCHTWGGTFSGPVGVSREESKNSLDSGNLLLLPIYACVDGPLRSTRKTPSVASTMMPPPPSPRAKLAMPVRALMASDAQLPAGLSAPGPQFRKDCWHLQKSSSGRRLRRGQRFFRNWAQQGDAEAGAWEQDAIRNITGTAGSFKAIPGSNRFSGAFTKLASTGGSDDSAATGPAALSFDASLVVHTGPQNVPQHVWQPLVIYLGRSSQV